MSDHNTTHSIEVIIPTLNEGSTIGKLIDSINSLKTPHKISILVIDGGSTDDTMKICKEHNVKAIRQKGRGKGTAMRESVEHTDADIIVFIDGDGTYSATDLESMIAPILNDEAEMVVGSRVLGEMEKGAITRFNRLGNCLFNKTINFALKSKVTDSLTGYRALRRDAFNDLVLFSRNFEIEIEMTVEALAKGYRVIEIPVKYGNRVNSKTKLNPVNDGLKISRTLFFIAMNVNPLKFFGLFMLGFIIVGLIPTSQAIYEKIFLGEITSIPSVILAALLFVSGAISLVIGVLSEIVVRSRHRIEYLISKNRKL